MQKFETDEVWNGNINCDNTFNIVYQMKVIMHEKKGFILIIEYN